jgi:hypothetical protein
VRDGRPAHEFTPVADSVRFSSAAVGGFGACSFRVPDLGARRWLPHLSPIRLYHGSRLLWEGRVEDLRVQLAAEAVACDVTCFGYRRLLEETSIRRVWSLRSLNWSLPATVSGLPGGQAWAPNELGVTIGQFDQGDLSRVGIRVGGGPGGTDGVSLAGGVFSLPGASLTLVRTLGKVGRPGGEAFQKALDSATGSSWTEIYSQQAPTAPTLVTLTNSAGATRLLLGGNQNAGSYGSSWEDVRVLCSAITESEEGGIYGHVLIDDLLTFVAGLSAGVVERSPEFAIPAIARVARDSVLSVLEEISAYYTREWAVWEDATFDWCQPSLDEPQWIVPLSEIASLDLDASVDGTTKTVYLLYEDAATGLPSESSATSSDRRNPYVRSGAQRDEILQAPVVMTATSGARLAERLAADRGAGPAMRGRMTLPAAALVAHAALGRQPAFTIRGGENVLVPDLPKDDYFRPGRDGQTLFHVTAAETDMAQQTTTLELEGYSRRSDVLLARVAAVTRTVGA